MPEPDTREIDDRIEECDAMTNAVIAMPHEASARDVALARDLALGTLLRQRRAAISGQLAECDRPISLQIGQGGKTYQRTFAAEIIKIGSGRNNHVVAPGVAPVHATLSRRGDGVIWLMNLGDSGITVSPVSGAPVKVVGAVPVQYNDVIVIGAAPDGATVLKILPP